MSRSLEQFKAFIANTELPYEKIALSTAEPLPDLTPQDLSGKTVLVTGANAGIGYEISKFVAGMKPAKLILACRSLEKGQTAVNRIKEATGYTAELWELDLASFASVKKFAKKYNQSGNTIDIFISNAGLVSHGWVVTGDGYELTAQVNHLSNVLLVLLLTPALHKAKNPRVVIVASDVHFWAVQPKQNDPHPLQTILTKPEQLSPLYTYPISKLLNVLFAQEYARRLPEELKIWIASANPGYCESELGSKDATGVVQHREPFDNGMKKRPTTDGAKSILFPAIDPHIGKSGGYYSEMKEAVTNSITHGQAGNDLGERLWKETIEILKPHLQEEGGYLESWVTK